VDINGLKDFKQTLVVRGVAQSSASAGKTILVRFLGSTVTCRIGRGVGAVAFGDIVFAARSGGELVVVDLLHATAPTSEPDDLNSYPPNPWDSVRTGTATVHPVETRTFRDTLGWRTDTDDCFHGKSGDNNQAGCAFYGSKAVAYSGAEVLSAYIKVKRDPGSTWSPSSEVVTLKRIEERTLTHAMVKDKTEPTYVSGTTPGPNLSPSESENFTIPKSWAQDLVDGTAGGLAINSNSGHPKARLEGRHSWGPAFTLVFTFRRVV